VTKPLARQEPAGVGPSSERLTTAGAPTGPNLGLAQAAYPSFPAATRSRPCIICGVGGQRPRSGDVAEGAVPKELPEDTITATLGGYLE